MSPLTGFIIVLVAITLQFTLYTIRRLQEPLVSNLLDNQKSYKNNNRNKSYWKNAEIMNGRLAMVGLLTLIINYGFFGWIIPGFI